jgi:hypothetical protein
MKGSVVFLLCLFCLFCLSGCGYTLQGTWKVNPLVEVEFRSDGSILALGQKEEGLSWHGDYICLKGDIKKLRDARTDELTRERKAMVSNAESRKRSRLEHAESSNWDEATKRKAVAEALKEYEKLADELKPIDQQLGDLKNGKVMEGGDYFPMAKGVDKKDISESADKVEVRIHWVDADHFDLGSTSFSRVKLPK